jgi:hypothetical protein
MPSSALPQYPDRARNRTIFGIVILVVVAAAVSVAVVLSKNGDDKMTPIVGNETTSAEPSLSPTRHPTRPSLSPVTHNPTSDPTLLRTNAPTVPTMTAAPSSLVVNQFLTGLPPYSLELATTNTSSPQAKALEWLQEDPLYHEYIAVYRLNQRYALAVLYYSTNGTSWWKPDWFT